MGLLPTLPSEGEPDLFRSDTSTDKQLPPGLFVATCQGNSLRRQILCKCTTRYPLGTEAIERESRHCRTHFLANASILIIEAKPGPCPYRPQNEEGFGADALHPDDFTVVNDNEVEIPFDR